ncbi:Ribosomal protein S18 acetylase RimI [Terribacillus halophilus]|uniref:Ribosomal protein S18 acetylase RimI n=1 Tax=Terribacillus halophilus TaxID=361279 RepID=A0A1G6U0Q0_9BACI|nr:GNAT family N-acetyltransferase [Terribacillus halophilus]SDD34898.1 Ribosomal protein S18 acetylase RimI [Terribacillus halophilus]
MNIRKATLQDVKQATDLFNQYRQFYKQANDLSGAEAYIAERLEKGDSVIFLAKDGDDCIGFMQLYPTFSSIGMKRAWILNDLYVVESARKQGVGERLLTAAEAFAKETGAGSIALSTAPDNEKAQRLYERKGYERDKQFYHYELRL